LRALSAQGDPLEKLAKTVDFELFRAELTAALGRRDLRKGGRPAFDPVLKFRTLVLQALHGLSLAQTEYLVADRLSWMRFCGLGPGDAVPDANTLWDFREALIASGAMERLFTRLDAAITAAGYLPMAGQIVDTAYRSAQNERHLAEIGRVSRIHRRKPTGRPMARHTARANAATSAVRAHVEHPFAFQKGVMGLVIRTIGLARAHAKITLANMAYNMKRWCWLDRRGLPA